MNTYVEDEIVILMERKEEGKELIWECELFGLGEKYWILRTSKNINFFWRFMQYVCFGNKWKKISKKLVKEVVCG